MDSDMNDNERLAKIEQKVDDLMRKVCNGPGSVCQQLSEIQQVQLRTAGKVGELWGRVVLITVLTAAAVSAALTIVVKMITET